MAREVTKVELTNSTGFPRSYTCASNVAITKGTVLALSDPRTAAANTTSKAACAGFASMEKANDDYATTITAWTDGVFKVYASGVITAGDELILSNPDNYVASHLDNAQTSDAFVIGYSLETAATGETFQMRLKL